MRELLQGFDWHRFFPIHMDLAAAVVLYMRRNRLGVAGLARHLRINPSLISRIRAGKGRVPVHSIDTWIDAFHLVGGEAQQFRLVVLLCHSPREVQQMIHDLRVRIYRLRQQEMLKRG
jgi:hypothetical protein